MEQTPEEVSELREAIRIVASRIAVAKQQEIDRVAEALLEQCDIDPRPPVDRERRRRKWLAFSSLI